MDLFWPQLTENRESKSIGMGLFDLVLQKNCLNPA